MPQNIFLDKEWQKSHLEKIKKRAGPRYTPKLNIDLPIADIFDEISRTKKFYIPIRKHYGKLNREFSRVPQQCGNEDAQKIYEAIRDEISQLSKLLDILKEYNTEKIPWDNINSRAQKASKMLWKLLDKLREEKDKAEQQKTKSGQKQQRSFSEEFDSNTHCLYRAQEELRYFEQLSSSTKAKLSNSQFLLLTGKAGIGKTHLLCDVVEKRITSENFFPAILVFGELFKKSEDPVIQIAWQLDPQLDKSDFLRLLDNAGKQSGCRAIIVIDALNETGQKHFWKRKLGKLIEEVKKYQNIALIVSVRTGFEEEAITQKTRTAFVDEEHRGFEFREWEAVDKFFTEFNLPLPEIPLLMPEFQHPLFLLLFCKAFQGRAKNNNGEEQQQIFRGHAGATHIFESFVKRVSKRIAKKFNIPNGKGKNIWSTVIKEIAAEMVKQHDDKISEDQLIALVKKAHPSINHDNFIKELEENLLIVKIPRYSIEQNDYDRFDFRFPFQKFSDHLIGRYIFKKYEEEFYEEELKKSNKNPQTAKKFFSKRRKLGKFLANSWNRGMIEALSIQCPEHLDGHELVEIAPYLQDSPVAQEAFVESLIWRKPTAFLKGAKNTLAYINAEIISTESGCSNLLNAFLSVAPIPGHPFNADFLHKRLCKFSMAKRDSWWSTFLHNQYQDDEKGSVDRLIEWGWSEHDKAHINDDAICLCSVALCWFLTTPNRFVRDKATKALVALLTDRLDVVLTLLKKFKDVNDPYVAERLYAVAYGCAIRSKTDKDGLKALSQWVYDEIFKQGNPPVHILLRDYARGVLEVALHEKIRLTMNQKKIEPPFNSSWPRIVPSEKWLKNRYHPEDYSQKNPEEHGFFDIWSSVMYSPGALADFGNYVLNSAVTYWSGRRLNGAEVNRKILDDRGSVNDPVEYFDTDLAQRWVFNRVVQLGWKQELHGRFDESIGRFDRSANQPERIGKKYQWMALHELLARIADNFEFKEEGWSEKIGKYEGPWQLRVRDIDPSCVLKESPNEKPEDVWNFSNNEIQSQYNAWNEGASDSTWLKTSRDLPDPKKIIEFVDKQGIAWVAFGRFAKWQETTPPEHENNNPPTRTLAYMVKSYLVKNTDKDEVFKWAKQQNFMGEWMPGSYAFHHVYLGEHPWAPAFLYDYHRDGWTNEARDRRIPAKILVTDDRYSRSESTIDCSTDKTISVKLPAKFIVDEMGLTQNHIDGRFFDKKGDLVAFDPGVFDNDMPGYVVVRKDKLSDFLKCGGYALLWTLLGRKMVTGQPLRWLEVDGAYILDGRNRITGTKRSRFHPPLI